MDPLNLTSSSEAPNPSGDAVQVAVSDTTGYVKVSGRGSFKISGSVKNFAARIQDNGGNQLVVDLKECIGMDSTFMGVLAGISQRFKRESAGGVTICGASEKITNLMTTLGLSRLVNIAESNPSVNADSLEELEESAQTPLESAETMLEAHENLVDLDDENALRFQDVVEYLREDIQRHQR